MIISIIFITDHTILRHKATMENTFLIMEAIAGFERLLNEKVVEDPHDFNQ